MIQSMTAFASRTGTKDSVQWVWEARSVNARGLDLRLRLPDGFEAMDPTARKDIGALFKRGNISLSLKVSADGGGSDLSINEAHLDKVLDALDQIQERAFAKGVTLGQPTAADVLAHRGVAEFAAQSAISADAQAAITQDLSALLAALREMRGAEGGALGDVIAAQIEQIGALVSAAEEVLEGRRTHAAGALQSAMQAVLAEAAVDPDRLVQELAVLAVKTDVTEEIDRLKAHVAAAKTLLAEAAKETGQPIGRKLDFLSQEFNREANTLCAKSQYPALTTIGLDLKTVIDQMREQVQNVE